MSSTLDVPGARLWYQAEGAGPPLVLVPGANGDARIFGDLAEQLARHHTVVTYDRRGFSRSPLLGPQDYARRLETDADDARRLIERVGNQPATVFGTSSGGVIALQVLARHPHVVQTLAVYEPAAMRQLPDGQRWLDFSSTIYDLYRRSGISPALKEFRERMFPESDWQVMARARDRELDDHAHANAAYWFEHELRQYTSVELDVDALLRGADRIVPLAGRQSGGYPTYRVSVELARKLGREIVELPGGHTGYVTHPAEFAHALLRALASTGAHDNRGGDA